MSKLHRTQIYLDEEQMQRLKIEAQKEHLSVSMLIRVAVKKFLSTRIQNLSWERDPLTKTIGKIKLDVTDASINHDQYLYGQKKRK